MTFLSLRLIRSTVFCSWLLLTGLAFGQLPSPGRNTCSIFINRSDKDTSFDPQSLPIRTLFPSCQEAIGYLPQLLSALRMAGYPAASIDHILSSDSSITIDLFAGPRYRWMKLTPSGIDNKVLEYAGIRAQELVQKPASLSKVRRIQDDLLRYYENNGNPFAEVYLDSVIVQDDSIRALLKANPSVTYRIDSISNKGSARIQRNFLQRYLMLPEGCLYNRSALARVDQRMRELSFLNIVQPSDVTLLGSGSVLNVYADSRKSNQINLLLGLLPPSGQYTTLQLTGDLLLDLRNVFGGGETMLVKWQQLQRKSPRLSLGFSKPYIFQSQVGFDFLFDLFRKDSSFLQINTQLSLDYFFSPLRTGRIYLQWQDNNLLEGGVDTAYVRQEKKLPANIDVSSVNLGGSYQVSNTNYRFNPTRGYEFSINAMAGIKNISPNEQIMDLSDAGFDYASLYDSISSRSYQIRLKAAGSFYLPLTSASAFKLGFSGGWYESPHIFRNELFQIGGFRLLRGFDDESIYATRYAVFTAEYRYLAGRNSFLFAFTDAGLVNNRYQSVDLSNRFLSLGGGIYFETKTGLLNICYAVGLRDDVKFDIREASKLHFGYNHYF